MTDVVQAVNHPTQVWHAWSLETGEEALILTTPVDPDAFPELAGFDAPRVLGVRANRRRKWASKEPESTYEQWKAGRRHL